MTMVSFLKEGMADFFGRPDKDHLQLSCTGFLGKLSKLGVPENTIIMKPVLLLLLVGHISMAQTLPDKLKGNVKKVERFSYRHEPGEEAYLLIHSCDSFNRQGKVVESKYFKDLRELVENRYTYEYDSRGNCTSSTSYGEDDVVEDTEKERYDAKGNKTERTEYGPDGKMRSRTQFIYNKANQMVEAKVYDSNGVLVSLFQYRYDAKGNEVEYWREQPQGQRLYRFMYTYSNSGLILTQQFEDEKKPDRNTLTRYTYNPEGLLTKIEGYDSKGIVERIVVVDWIFDDRGNWTRRFDAEEVFHEKGSYTTEVRVQRIISYY